MKRSSVKITIFICGLLMLSGCAGTKPFHELARAGDTVAVAAGRVKNFTRNNMTVTITPSSGNPIIYVPNHPAVRAILNLYPDPVSSLLVSLETQQNLTPSAMTYGGIIRDSMPNSGKDWWQTSVFIDLPSSLPVGTTAIELSTPTGGYSYSEVEIVSGTGKPNSFSANVNGPLNPNQLASMERVPHYTVDFSGSTVPFAIQVDFSHNPDANNGGSGRAYVINPRGDLKNVSWSGTGTSLRVIIMPARSQALSNVHDYQFYVAGGVANLSVLNVKAVDINGNNVSGVTAAVE